MGLYDLTEERALVVGLGEVGRPLFELLRDSGHFTVYGSDIDEAKMRELEQDRSNLPNEVDVMHICVPCWNKEEFMNITVGYVKQFKPSLVVINSTVPPGTTQEIDERCNCLVAHSPVRGVHKSVEHMKWEFKRWTKYVGGVNKESSDAACKHFEKAGCKTMVLKSSLETELAKLFETTYRAWMIACFQEMHRISRHFGADFVEVVDFLEDTHRVRLDRPIMFPGVIGGHCILANAELLLKSYDSTFLRLILESNEKRKEEIKDEDVTREVEKVKKRVEALEKYLAKSS